MSKPSSYDLLVEVLNRMDKMDERWDKRVSMAEGRVDILESKVDNMLGRIGVGVMIVSALISSGIAYLFSLFRSKS